TPRTSSPTPWSAPSKWRLPTPRKPEASRSSSCPPPAPASTSSPISRCGAKPSAPPFWRWAPSLSPPHEPELQPSVFAQRPEPDRALVLDRRSRPAGRGPDPGGARRVAQLRLQPRRHPGRRVDHRPLPLFLADDRLGFDGDDRHADGVAAVAA